MSKWIDDWMIRWLGEWVSAWLDGGTTTWSDDQLIRWINEYVMEWQSGWFYDDDEKKVLRKINRLLHKMLILIRVLLMKSTKVAKRPQSGEGTMHEVPRLRTKVKRLLYQVLHFYRNCNFWYEFYYKGERTHMQPTRPKGGKKKYRVIF